jgi:hypothetical protein
MPTPPIIPQDYLAAVSAVTAIFSHILREAGLSKTMNTIVSAIAILVITLSTIWITTGFSADIRSDVLLGCSIAVSLFSGGKEFADLLSFLYGLHSPIAPTPVPSRIPARASRDV